MDYIRRDGAEITYESCVPQLQLAKTVDLDIFLNIPTIPPPNMLRFWMAWEAVKKRAGQWRSFRLGREVILSAAHEPGLLLPLSLPNLIEAEFGCISAYNIPPISTPKLRELRLTRQNGNLCTPFFSTEALEIIHYTGPISHAIRLLQGSPHIHTLYLNNGFGRRFSSEWTAGLPNLRCIEVRGTIACLASRLNRLHLITPKWEVLRIVCDVPKYHLQEPVPEPVHLPSLTTIEYESHPGFALAPFRSFLSTLQQSSLKSLEIRLSTATLSQPSKFQSFKSSDADYQWMEDRVAKVTWSDAVGDGAPMI